MTRYMYDSVNPAAIPSSATMIAGYADGRYANLDALRARFPHATLVSIAVRHTSRAHVLDVENGDATPAEAVQWLTQTMHDLDNGHLTVYCNMSVWPTVRGVIRAAGITEPQYWVARYDNDPTLPAGAVAKQYIGDHNGYDQSVVADYWPGVDPAPAPKPSAPQWRKLLDHVLSIPEKVYETWTSGVGWNNVTQFGKEYGEDGVSWCVIYNWDMFHDVGLDGIVPKTDNVNSFTSWAKAHGQWSLYPSVGAWVNFDGGGHTEIVVGFDDQFVYTKGGNSIQAGAADNGQGNGVWSHRELRRATRVTGYLAPHFPDGICPPTADPSDPRGGKAVASWRSPSTPAPKPTPTPKPTPAPKPTYEPFPGAGFFVAGHRSPIIAAMHKRLVAEGCNKYQSSANADVWGPGDVRSYAAWQRKLGYAGAGADGTPGATSWAKLHVPNV